MENLFARYKTAKQLKLKEFNEPCLAFYVKPYRDNNHVDFRYNYEKQGLFFKHNSDEEAKSYNDPDCKCSAPLYQQVVDWLRDTHKIHVAASPFPVYDGRYGYQFSRQSMPSGWTPHFKGTTHYEALEKAIEEALQSIPAKKNKKFKTLAKWKI